MIRHRICAGMNWIGFARVARAKADGIAMVRLDGILASGALEVGMR